jgi:hypothetical protein
MSAAMHFGDGTSAGDLSAENVAGRDVYQGVPADQVMSLLARYLDKEPQRARLEAAERKADHQEIMTSITRSVMPALQWIVVALGIQAVILFFTLLVLLLLAVPRLSTAHSGFDGFRREATMGRPSSIDAEKAQALIAAYARTKSVAGAAREVGVTESAARRFFDGLPADIAATPAVVETVAASLQEPFAALQANFERLQRLCDVAQAANTPREIQAYTGVIKEIREHVEAATRLASLIVSTEEQRRFQQAVIDAIGEADDATKRRIINILRERRSVGLALLRTG